MNCKVLFICAVLAAITVTIDAVSTQKRQAEPEDHIHADQVPADAVHADEVPVAEARALPAGEERPEPPTVLECEQPGETRETCFSKDFTNYENYRIYMQWITEWERKNPSAAQAYNAKNPNVKTQEENTYLELEGYTYFHSQ